MPILFLLGTVLMAIAQPALALSFKSLAADVQSGLAASHALPAHDSMVNATGMSAGGLGTAVLIVIIVIACVICLLGGGYGGHRVYTSSYRGAPMAGGNTTVINTQPPMQQQPTTTVVV